MKKSFYAIILLLISDISSNADGLPHEIVYDQDNESVTAKIGKDGSVALTDTYASYDGKDYFLWKEPGKALKSLPRIDGEDIELLGISDSGEIVGLSKVRNATTKSYSETNSLFYLNPNTTTRRNVPLSAEEFSGIDSQIAMNATGSIAIVREGEFGSHQYRVTFIEPDLAKQQFDIKSSFPIYGEAISYLSTDGVLFTSGSKENTGIVLTIEKNGKVAELDSHLFGSNIPIDNSGGNFPTDKLTMVYDGRYNSPKNNKAYVGIYDIKTKAVNEIVLPFPRREIPSFENAVYALNPKIGSDGAVYVATSSSGYSKGYYLGTSVLKVHPNGATQHLNCYIDPKLGYVDGDPDLLQTNVNGQALVRLSKNNTSRRKIVRLNSLNLEAATNYCVQVKAYLSRGCNGYFEKSGGSFKSLGYADLKGDYRAPKGCSVTMDFADVAGKPVVGEPVSVRLEPRKLVKQNKTNRFGRVKFDLHDFLGTKGGCGWMIRLENESRYQPNGVVFFNNAACRRI